MAPRKRTKAQIESDRVAIMRLYLQGKWQHEIAADLGMQQEQVSYDLRAIQAVWRDIPQSELSELKAKELARIDELERTYWQAWERSLTPKETTSTAKEGGKLKVGKRSEQRNGNPAFLKGVMDCIDRRCKLLGLDAPLKNELSGVAGDGGVIVYLPDNFRDGDHT